ncbi:hypothetical protein VTH06DRAFT_7277 [Thermothelomyces fergusii]
MFFTEEEEEEEVYFRPRRTVQLSGLWVVPTTPAGNQK